MKLKIRINKLMKQLCILFLINMFLLGDLAYCIELNNHLAPHLQLNNINLKEYFKDTIEIAKTPQNKKFAEYIKSFIKRFIISDDSKNANSDISIGRRKFIKGLGILTGAAITYALVPPGIANAGLYVKKANPELILKKQEEKKFIDKLRYSKMTVGNHLNSLLKNADITLDTNDPIWKLFLNSLNSSDWLMASKIYNEQQMHFMKLKESLTIKGETDLISYLDIMFSRLSRANKIFELYANKDNKEKYVTWFDAGTYPLIFDQNTYSVIQDQFENADFFYELDLFNNISKPRAITSTDIPVYIGYAHYWALYAWMKELGPKTKKRTLFHFDAHRDLASYRLNNDFLDAFLNGNFNNEMLGRITQKSDIDGFIIPAVYAGIIDKIIWVVPEEANESSNVDYVPEYNKKYEILIGKAMFRGKDTFVSVSLDGNNVFGSYEKGYIKEEWEGENAKFTNVRKVEVHLVSPKDAIKLKKLADEDQDIILDVDQDFLGTKEPFLSRKAELPAYTTSNQRFEQLLQVINNFYNDLSIQEKIKVISLAKSPNFTTQAKERSISARLLHTFLGSSVNQTEWVQEELNSKNLANLASISFLAAGIKIFQVQNKTKIDQSI